MELVIVFPVAMVVILLAIQTGLWFLARSAATDAATDGARAAAEVGGSPAIGQAQAASALAQVAGPVLAGTSIQVSKTNTTATVTITGHSESILPGLSLPIDVSVSRPREVFHP